jgi:hypothetical protein
MNTLKHFLTLLLILSFCNICFAQNPDRKIQNEKRKIQNFFLNDLPWKNTPDSTMIIGFSFKISVQENEKGIKQVISITASESVAYKLFPNYESLKKIDYKLFMKDKKEADLIIPVLIEMVGPYQKDYNSYEKLLKFYEENIFRREMFNEIRAMLHIDPLWDNTKTEEYIYFEPVFIWMDKRNKK